MKSPYELAKDILLSDNYKNTTEAGPSRFTSIDLYGAFASENDAADGSCCNFHLANKSGTHEEHMRNNGLYHKLVELQTAAAD